MHAFDAAFSRIQPALLAAMLVFWLIAVVARVRRKPGFALGVGGFLALGFCEAAGVAAITVAAQQEIAPILAAELRSVSVDGKPFAEGATLVALLRNPQNPWAHHSHPLARSRVRIETSAGATEVRIARDSGDPREYWVFYNGFEATKSKEVGHIVTDLLDGVTPSPAPEPVSTPPSNPP